MYTYANEHVQSHMHATHTYTRTSTGAPFKAAPSELRNRIRKEAIDLSMST